MEMPEVIYRLEGITKAYGERTVLEIPELEIYRGEIFGIVGPSGAGKSTLLRLLNFLEFPTLGSISFAGVRFNGREPPLEVRRRMVMVFQRPILLNRSVAANIAYGLRVRGLKDVRRRVEEALRLVGLEALAHQPARTLSGGEAQRVALARALVLKPEVLLLDEPTANLDPYNVRLIEEAIRRANEEWGSTVVLVTHNVFQARRLAHRVAFLLEGKLVEVSPTEDFFDSPSDPRTAAFVRGEMVY